MSSQARVAGAARSGRAESTAGLVPAARFWLTKRWVSDTAALASQGIEQVEDVDGAVIVRVRGDLDLCSSPELRSVLAELLRTRRPTILDLSAIRFIDCCGLGVVLWAAGAGKAESWSFVVAAERAPCVARLVRFASVGAVLSHAQIATDAPSAAERDRDV